MFRIDDHCGIVISGLTSDARSLCKYMRTEALEHKFVFESPVQVERLVADVADKHQKATQSYVRRPYGVGLLVAGYDVRIQSKGTCEDHCHRLNHANSCQCSERAHTCTKQALTATITRGMRWPSARAVNPPRHTWKGISRHSQMVKLFPTTALIEPATMSHCCCDVLQYLAMSSYGTW